MANILVTGSNGQLGSELQKIGFTALDEVWYTDVENLDITDYRAVSDFVQKNEIDTIINCAAYTAVDKAEDEPALATKINTDGAATLARVAEDEACLLIHISTDYVFDGTNTVPYTEKDKVHPTSVYGATKLAGEKAIKNSGCMYIIIRTSWLYSSFGNNFVKTIRRLAAEREEINVVADQKGSPTYAEDLARGIVAIITDHDVVEKEGIYHFSDNGVCSWYDFATEIVNMSGLKCKVNPVTSEEYPSKVRRPAYSVLDKTKIKTTFDVKIPEWKEALGRCLSQMD